MEASKTFPILVGCSFLMSLSMSLIIPFFPPYALKQGVSEQLIGFIISAQPIGSFVASLVIGKILTEKNQFRFMVSGLVVLALGLFVFAATKLLDSASAIIIVGTIGRLINGIGSTCFMTPFYAYIPKMYSSGVEEKIAAAEMFSGLGYLVGPIIGSILYSIGGYIMPFIGFAPIVHAQFKQQSQISEEILNLSSTDLESAQTSITSPLHNNMLWDDEKIDVEITITKISYLDTLFSYKTFMCCLLEFAINFLFTFVSPVMADFLENTYQASPSNVGILMSVNSLTYTLSCLCVGKISKGKPYFIFFGLILLSVSEFFVGPDKLLTGLNYNIMINVGSQAIIGFGASFLFILTLPMMTEQLNQKYPGQEDECANVASALFGSAMALGELLGPICGGYLSALYGMEHACSFLGLAMLVLSGLFFPMLFMKIERKNSVHATVSPEFVKECVF